jgi:hypothetical protein
MESIDMFLAFAREPLLLLCVINTKLIYQKRMTILLESPSLSESIRKLTLESNQKTFQLFNKHG